MKDGQSQQLFSHMFCENNFPVTLVNDVRFLQLMLGSSQAEGQMSYEMTVPVALAAQIYFHVVAMMSIEPVGKKLNNVLNVV